MGVVITASGFAGATEPPSDRSPIRTAHIAPGAGAVEQLSRAGRAAIDAAGVDDGEVGVLINTGVYRDANMVEPAIGALVQQGIGLGLEYERTDPKCFSFDLMNGACGLLNAVQVAGSLFVADKTSRILVVGGDTHPSTTRPKATDEFPYDTAGAAVLLEHRDGADGFSRVHTGLGRGETGVEGFVDTASMGTEGRSTMTVRRRPGFDAALLDLAVATAAEALDEEYGANHSDEAREGVVLIASRPTPNFGRQLADRLGLPLAVADLSGDTHTAALVEAYHLAASNGALRSARTVLFVGAGAGPSAAAVLYRIPEERR